MLAQPSGDPVETALGEPTIVALRLLGLRTLTPSSLTAACNASRYGPPSGSSETSPRSAEIAAGARKLLLTSKTISSSTADAPSPGGAGSAGIFSRPAPDARVGARPQAWRRLAPRPRNCHRLGRNFRPHGKLILLRTAGPAGNSIVGGRTGHRQLGLGGLDLTDRGIEAGHCAQYLPATTLAQDHAPSQADPDQAADQQRRRIGIVVDRMPAKRDREAG